MSFNTFSKVALSVVVAAGLVVGTLPEAYASHIDWDAWRAEREAEREARRAAREAEKNEPSCTCSASLSYDKPSLQFSNGVLTLTPRVNIRIRSRGDTEAPAWQAHIAHSGETAFQSADVTPPAGSSFSGEQDVVGGSCGTSYSLQGYALPTVPMSGLTQSLVGQDQKLAGVVKLQTELRGCGDAEVLNRQFSFDLRQFGNVRVRGWSFVR